MSDQYGPRKVLAIGLAMGLPIVLCGATIATAVDYYNSLAVKAYTACVSSAAVHDVRDCGRRP